MTLPDVWYLCDEPDWLNHASKVYEAGECLIQLRLMALEKRMQDLLMQVRTAERTLQDTSALASEYTITMKQRQEFQTKEGKLKFINNLLTESYENRKREQEEVLPL